MITEKFDSSNYAFIATIIGNIELTLCNQGKYDEAFHFHQRELNILETYHPFNYEQIASTLRNMGNIRIDQRRYDEAINLYLQALPLYEKSYPSHIDLANTLMNIGYIKYKQRKLTKRSIIISSQWLYLNNFILSTIYCNFH
jgi:tetratricopeptide (TPR) repeat protein